MDFEARAHAIASDDLNPYISTMAYALCCFGCARGAALALLLVVASCATATSSPLRFERSSDPKTFVTVSIPSIGPCQSDSSGGMTIDPARSLVVLVHGCHSSPGRFTTLARLLETHDQQVVCFNYDDRERLDDSAGHLVAALEALKAHVDTRHITVLGHSQGGLIARRALIRDAPHGLRDGDGFRYELITVSAPFHGIESSADCGSMFLRVVTLGVTVAICRVVAGAMWNEIHAKSSFMRHPGSLLASVERHVRVVTDERRTCRRRDRAGGCVKSDFVFSLSEQSAPPMDGDARVHDAVVQAGHVEIVGEAGNPPRKLIRLLQEQRILAVPAPAERAAYEAFIERLYM